MFGPVQHDDQGAAAVEFALVSVLLFTLLFGIIQYGFLFFQYQAAAATAHDAARRLVIGPTDTQMVSGSPNACIPFATSVGTIGEQNGLPQDAITMVRVGTVTAGAPFQPGTLAKVTVTFEPTAFGAAFVPMPGQIDVVAVGTIEVVGALTPPCAAAP